MKWSLLKSFLGYFHHLKYLHLQTLLAIHFTVFQAKIWIHKKSRISLLNLIPPFIFRLWQNSKSVPWPEWQLLKDWIAWDRLQPRWDMWCKVFLTLLSKIKKWMKSNHSFLREKAISESYQKKGARSWWTLVNFSILTILSPHLSS